jgi:short-subunit dehydrogenase
MGETPAAFKPKRLCDQVVVITGASSGIGLSTARKAATRGARVVLAARNEDELARIAGEIRTRGGRAIYVTADVADPTAVDRIADVAIAEFGGFDTWINNAGIAVYGKSTEVPLEDKRRMFDTNFWGVVHGCRTAIRYFRQKGGTIINIGSVVSDRASPLLAVYSASKHAVQGYTDALRMELEHDQLPIAMTLVKPGSTNTPFVDHSRNYMEQAPYYAPPVYDPEVVAEAILKCAEKPVREVTIGGGSRMLGLMGKFAPRTTDLYMESTMFTAQQDPERPSNGGDSLDVPARDGDERGPYRGHVMHSSLYTTAMLSNVTRALPFIAAAAVFAAGVRRRSHGA